MTDAVVSKNEKKSQFTFDLLRRLRGTEFLNLYVESGRVKKVLGPIVEGILPGATVGGICRLRHQSGKYIESEIVGFRDRTALLMPLESVEGVAMGARIEQSQSVAQVVCGPWMIGKLLNGVGQVVKEKSESTDSSADTDIEENQKQLLLKESELNENRPIKSPALLPHERASIQKQLELGVRAIDSTIPVGQGQRLGIMAASGVGKSVLMGMIARQSKADVNVIALIGERGREVTEFLERDLGPEGMKKSIVVAVTSDESPVLKVRGALVATTIAEYFRDQGKQVLLMMDSVTRYGMALREIGLASGEPPTSKGYTPSVFAQLPRLLERAGSKKNSGSITALYTVLVEGNDFDDPVADAVRAIVDGHIVLSRTLAERNHYPAIDVLASISRLTSAISSERSRDLNGQIRWVLSTYKNAEDLINIGGYRKGNNPEWDKAIDLYPKVVTFLKQRTHEHSNVVEVAEQLEAIFRG
jgi:flagellum-specific ATP synthase